MVRILPSGEIVADNDPRVRQAQAPQNRLPQQQRGQINQGGIDQQPIAHGPDASIVDSLNDKLLAAGVPRWNMGSWVVEPIASAGFVLLLLLVGVHGLIFGLLLFAVVKWSQGGGGPGMGWQGWQGGGGGDRQGDERQDGERRRRRFRGGFRPR